MIVVEYSTDDYGKVMEYISCIEKKAKCIKEIIEEDTMNQRMGKKRRSSYMDEDDDYEYEDKPKHYKGRFA